MLDLDAQLKKIAAILAHLDSYLHLLSGQNLNDAAVLFEDACIPLLNEVFGLTLTNANAEIANFPAADLIARSARRGFQITINATTKKIRETHRTATALQVGALIDQLTIFFVTQKAPPEPEENSAFTRCTSPSIDSLDINGLLTKIRTLGPQRVAEIAHIIERDIAPKIPAAPRDIPAICNLPFDSLRHLFIGRKDFQEKLRTTIASSRTAVIRGKQAIHGMGGVGKTRAAVEYAWAHASEYTALLFISADSPQTLRTNLAALCAPTVLGLPEHTATDFETQHNAVLKWLAHNPDWLLIIDNADTPDAKDAVRQLTQKIPHGHILITTRLADWPAEFTTLDLDVLDEKDSIHLLLTHTADRRTERPDDEATAARIAHHLGGLALALEQAAAWVNKECSTLADYLAEWEKTHALLHEKYGDNWVADYPRSLYTTYRASIAQLSPEARTLLAQLAWLPPEPIPMSFIAAHPTIPEPRKHFIELTKLHLARRTRDGETGSIHRMLQAIGRAEQGEEKPDALVAALQWVERVFLFNDTDPSTWPICKPLIPHLVSIANAAVDHGNHALGAHLLSKAATTLKWFADFREAEIAGRKAVALSEKHLGSGHEYTATNYNNLATILLEMDQFAEAESLFRKALAIDKYKFGESSPQVAHRLNNFATLLMERNHLKEAESMMRQSLAIDEAFYGENHPEVAIRLNNLAQVLHCSDQLNEAEGLMIRALAIDTKVFGAAHPRLGNRKGNLAELLFETGRLKEAEPLMRDVLEISSVNYGRDHPMFARALNNLANLLTLTGRGGEAEPLLCEALAIDEARYGKDHSRVARKLNNLAQVLISARRFDEAETMMRRALEIDEKNLDKDHPVIAEHLSLLGLILFDTGRAIEAEPMLRRAFEINMKFSDENDREHRNLKSSLAGYGNLLIAMGHSQADAFEKIRAIAAPYGLFE